MSVSPLNKRWTVAEPSPEKEEALAREFNLPPIVARLLINRKIETPAEAEFFLKADLTKLHDPFLMLGMKQAVDRIVAAIESGEKITVYGDYDVDGVTAAALMVHFLRELDAPHDYYIPERMVEGYGVNKEALKKIRGGGSVLVLTADCGITAVEETAFANEIGLDVIISDHHQVGEGGLPDAIAILNPHQEGCRYPYRFLSGVGIVFKIAAAVRTTLHQKGWDKERLPNMKKHLDLFALGTIADLAPLTGENHVLSLHGLEAMRTTQKPGLVALKAIAGSEAKMDSVAVGFGLGPRLNAAGRLGKADSGFHLLTCQDLKQAHGMAQSLDDINEERKKIQSWTQEEAEYLMDREAPLEGADSVIVIASENFHPGVIGIVASRFVERYYRPVILIAMKDGAGKGSARSIPGFNIFKAMTDCSRFLGQFGGHAYAAGLNIEANRLDDFKKAINEVGRRYLTPDKLVPELIIDAPLILNDIDRDFFDAMQVLAPFGRENPAPVFMSAGVTIQGLRFVGKEKNHARFQAVQGGHAMQAIGFKMAGAFRSLQPEEPVDIVYEINLNEWNGRESLQLKLLDLRPHSPEL